MSQHEFEHYLSLLSRLLHLTESQRADIADELRDHLEERTAALVAAGSTPEEAIRRAVEEFGDAAALARNLAKPRAAQRRRRLARWGLGAAIAAAIAAFAIWPTNPPTITSVVVAQDPKPAAASPAKASDPATLAAERRRTMVEKKLDEDGIAVSFVDTPLREVLSFVSDAIDVPILIDRKRLEEEGISDEQALSLMLKAGTVSNRTALELILGEADLSFSVREGVVIVTTRSQESQQYEVRVYPCQDLLNAAQTAGGDGQFFGGAGAAGPGGFGAAPPMAGAAMPGMPGATPAPPKGAGGGGLGTAPRKSTHPAGEALRDVIMSMTGSEWNDVDGQGGDLREYGGMMIVRHKQEVHRRIEELIARMRETQRKQ